MKRRSLCCTIACILSTGSATAQESLRLQDLNGVLGVRITGVAAGDRAGQSVSAAGDVNGDGLDDVIIGAPFADPDGNSGAGESYLVFGTDQGFASPLSLAELDGSNGLVITGIDAGDRSGFSVSAAGDVNGDSIDDLIIGAYRANPDGILFAGESYLVFGSDQGFVSPITLADLNGTNGLVINGIDASDFSGGSVSAVGDVNGDGIDDVIIGASSADPDGQLSAGESYLVFGTDQGFTNPLALAGLNGSSGLVITGIDAGDRSGFSVSAAGDANGDGIDDVIIGAYRADPNGKSSAGESYLVFGTNQGFVSPMTLADLNGSNGLAINGVDDDDLSGRSVSAVGDVNGDGVDDLIIGAQFADPGGNSYAGESYLLFGTDQELVSPLPLSDLNGSDGVVLSGIGANDQSGRSVSAAGDMNGDGIGDLIIGAYRANPDGNTYAGESYLVFGTDQSFINPLDLSTLNGRNGLVITGINSDDQSGISVSSAGDVNGDGIDDLIIGANNAGPDGNSGAGESYLVFGNAAPLSLGSSLLLGAQTEDNLAPLGSRLDFSIAERYLDEDSFGGVAVINDASTLGEGLWQHSSDGLEWTDLPGALSDTSALVLGAQSLLRFVPAADFHGQPGPLTVRLWDGRWRDTGENVDITSAVDALGGFADDDNLLSVTLTVNPVNDSPSFSAINPPTVNEDPGGATVADWSTFDPGPFESEQFALTYQVDNISNPGLFSVLPTIGTLGNLVYNPAPDVSGSSTFDVRVVDSGGMDNGGVNVSGFQTFTVTVNPVNDPPRIVADDPPPVLLNSGPQTVPQWASVDAGAPDEQDQQVTLTVSDVSNGALFAKPPAVDAVGNLTYTPAEGAIGVSTYTVIASDDGGTANGGQNTTGPAGFTIQVRSELLFSDSFEE
ncbi:MAG: Ig-like domain-containing protein [Pseudomonadota bacterium]